MNRKENHLSELLKNLPNEDAQIAQELAQLAATIKPEPRYVDEVAAQLRASAGATTKPFNTFLPQRRFALVGTAFIALLMIVVVLASPPLRVAAQELFRFFVPVESDTLTVPTRRPTAAVEAIGATNAGGGPSFAIRLPTMLPKGYGLEQVLTNEEQKLALHYATDGRVLVFEQEFVGDADLPAMGPPEGVFSTQVGDVPAEFTAGLWRPVNSDTEGNIESVGTLENPDEAAARGLAWFAQSGFNRLRWRENGVRYLLTAAGGSEGSPGYLGMLELVRVAESLAPVSNNTAAWSVGHFAVSSDDVQEAADSFSNSVDEVAAQAAFDPLVPATLPPNYSFDGAAYDLANAETTFAYSCGGGEWRLWLLQRRLESEEAEQQLALLRSQIGASAEVKAVPLDGATAEYVQGAWVPEAPRKPGAPRVWNSSLNFHHLVWYTDGILYQIRTSGGLVAPYSGPCSLDVSVLTTMASSLQ